MNAINDTKTAAFRKAVETFLPSATKSQAEGYSHKVYIMAQAKHERMYANLAWFESEATRLRALPDRSFDPDSDGNQTAEYPTI